MLKLFFSLSPPPHQKKKKKFYTYWCVWVWEESLMGFYNMFSRIKVRLLATQTLLGIGTNFGPIPLISLLSFLPGCTYPALWKNKHFYKEKGQELCSNCLRLLVYKVQTRKLLLGQLSSTDTKNFTIINKVYYDWYFWVVWKQFFHQNFSPLIKCEFLCHFALLYVGLIFTVFCVILFFAPHTL